MIVLGIEKGTSKKTGSPYTVVHLSEAFDLYAQEYRQAKGQKVQTVFLRGDSKDLEIGDNVELEYKPDFSGKAVVSRVRVVS